MPEKKTVIAVVLGASFVSLVAALIAGLANGLMLLTDFHELYDFDFRYDIIVALVELAVILFGIVLVALFLLLKKNRTKTLIYTCIAYVISIVVTVIVLKATLPEDFGPTMYSLYTSYVTTAITVMVSAILFVVSYCLLQQQNVKPTTDEQNNPENVEQPAQQNDTLSDN